MTNASGEMIGLIDVRGSFRDFASRNKSFNVFTELASPPQMTP